MTEAEPAAAVVRKVLPVPPEVVYDEWLDPDALTEWMCPRPARATRVDVDPTVGGRLRIDIDDEGSRMVISGRFLGLDRPRRLQFTWTCSTWPDSTPDSMVTVTLEPHADEATLMTIHHALLPPDLLDDHEHGWVQIASQLAHRLGRL